jgi:hypothetical protein
MGATSFAGEDYENKPCPGLRENKAKQSQIHKSSGKKGITGAVEKADFGRQILYLQTRSATI